MDAYIDAWKSCVHMSVKISKLRAREGEVEGEGGVRVRVRVRAVTIAVACRARSLACTEGWGLVRWWDVWLHFLTV